MPDVLTTPEIRDLIRSGCPVSISVSGGKDSCAVALATNRHLDSVGHSGPRILIHSDLGSVEWTDSLPTCERLARRLGIELVTVQRAAGGMMERWKTRWRNSVERYINLECVKLILPWSTASMRFCTAELKRDVMSSYLKRRFKGQTVLSVCGIRRDESRDRAKAPVAKDESKMKTKITRGITWNAIPHWSTTEVFAFLESEGFPLHDAYLVWNMRRVSCRFCILATTDDHQKAAADPEAVAIFREMVGLEIASTFAFQNDKWLGDAAPALLTEDARAGLVEAKRKAEIRRQIESAIPDELLYVSGWPHSIPTPQGADLLCQVRTQVGELMGFEMRYTDPNPLTDRYLELWELGEQKRRKKSAKPKRRRKAKVTT